LGTQLHKKFENLSSFHIGLTKSISEQEALEFTNEGLIDFTKQIGKKFINLQSLTLSFSYCANLTTNGIKGFGKLFEKYFKQLKELTLSFSS